MIDPSKAHPAADTNPHGTRPRPQTHGAHCSAEFFGALHKVIAGIKARHGVTLTLHESCALGRAFLVFNRTTPPAFMEPQTAQALTQAIGGMQ